MGSTISRPASSNGDQLRTISEIAIGLEGPAIPSENLDENLGVDETAPKRLVILGATGSIGRSCAQVIDGAPGRFEIVALAAGRDGAALARSAIALNAPFAALADPAGYADLKAGVAGKAESPGQTPAQAPGGALTHPADAADAAIDRRASCRERV